METLNLFIKSIFIDNMVFAYFLGMCSYLAVSKNVKTAMGLGIAVTFVLAITLPVNYLLENYILKAGALQWLGEQFAGIDLSFLSLILFIAVIASMVQLLEMIIEKYSPSLYNQPIPEPTPNAVASTIVPNSRCCINKAPPKIAQFTAISGKNIPSWL